MRFMGCKQLGGVGTGFYLIAFLINYVCMWASVIKAQHVLLMSEALIHSVNSVQFVSEKYKQHLYACKAKSLETDLHCVLLLLLGTF